MWGGYQDKQPCDDGILRKEEWASKGFCTDEFATDVIDTDKVDWRVDRTDSIVSHNPVNNMDEAAEATWKEPQIVALSAAQPLR